MTREERIKRVCVIGAGTMGSGIAAHLANVGYDVSLLDASQASVTEAFERARSAKPPHFYTSETANLIRLGNTTDHLSWLSEADWVCEAIVERLEAKRSLFARIEPFLAPHTLVSTNTSGLEISLLSEGRGEAFRRKFVGTHFFNPPRYLKLLELIPTPDTAPEILEQFHALLERDAARRVVSAKDTPGFIANRFGMWCMFTAIHAAERLHLSIEEVDAITGAFLGRPKSASFRLNDLVGLDVMKDIAANLMSRCTNDPQIANLRLPNSMVHLLARGWLGEKTGHGYYRRDGKDLLVLDLQTYIYRQKRDVVLPTLQQLADKPLAERLRLAVDARDEVGEYLRMYLVPALRYAHAIQEEISHSVLDFDRVMEWGFGWQMGPFAMIDCLGAERVGIPGPSFFVENTFRSHSGEYVPVPKPIEYATLDDFPIVHTGDQLDVRDMGDGVSAICTKTKLGVLNPDLVEELLAVLAGPQLAGPIVLTSAAKAFSVGFDLNFFLDSIQQQRWTDIDHALVRLQHLGEQLERRRAVAAIHGYCLGGGLELALSCSHIVALAETNIGLPESKVGLLPAGRGLTLTRIYNRSTVKRLAEVTMAIVRGEISASADQARMLGYLRPTDLTVYHPDRLLSEAKRVALAAEPVPPVTWSPLNGPLLGMLDRSMDQAMHKGELTEFDVTIGHKIKQIVGRSESYEESLLRERSEFVELCSRAFTAARLRHMLETNRPLRN